MIKLLISAELDNADGSFDLKKIKAAFADANLSHINVDMVIGSGETVDIDMGSGFVKRSLKDIPHKEPVVSVPKEEVKETVLKTSDDIEEAASEITEPAKAYTAKDISGLVTEVKNKFGRERAAELVHKYAASVSKIPADQLSAIGAEADAILKGE